MRGYHPGWKAIAALATAFLLVVQPEAVLAYFDGPTLVLEGEAEHDAGIAVLADYSRERLIEGIGWQIASAVRPDKDGALPEIMSRAYTVILPARGDAKPLRHMYVLAGFDLLPDCRLLVVIRDPQFYWADYDPKQGVSDVIELVWYDRDWNEYANTPLDYELSEYPDDFLLSPKQLHLLAIRHPVEAVGSEELAPEGHSLNLIRLKDGLITDLPLPEADEAGSLPAEWLPLLMRWDEKGRLQVQAGSGLRKYSLDWDSGR